MSQSGISDKASSSISRTLKNLWKESTGEAPPLLEKNDILIGVMGMTGVGKTSFIEQITDLNMEVGHGLDFCTKEVQVATTKIGDHVVRFIDTPGFDDTDTKDSDVLMKIWEHISSIKGLRLSGLLYLHRITDDRVGGTAMKNLRMFQKLVGNDSMKNVVLVTTMWGKLQQSDDGDARVEQLIETGKFWGGMITSGARHERYDGTEADALRITQMILDNTPRKLQIQNELDQGRELADTAAGKEVADRLETLKAQHAKEIAELNKEINQAAQNKNDKLQQELQALHKTELKQQQEIAEAQRKLQQAEMESLQARIAQLENKGGCVVC